MRTYSVRVDGQLYVVRASSPREARIRAYRQASIADSEVYIDALTFDRKYL